LEPAIVANEQCHGRPLTPAISAQSGTPQPTHATLALPMYHRYGLAGSWLQPQTVTVLCFGEGMRRSPCNGNSPHAGDATPGIRRSAPWRASSEQ